jgi:fatty acid desaturase
MIRQAETIVQRGGGIPVAINGMLAVFYIGVNLLEYFVLPIYLLPRDSRWAWLLLPIVLLSNPFWSLIHEAIHDLLHANKSVNLFIGRLLGVLFGSPFRILRLSHLLHHKLNRMPVEGSEFYDRDKGSKAAAAPGYYFQILVGLYLVEAISPLYFFLPRCWLEQFRRRYLPAHAVSGMLMQNWLGSESLREIRRDGALTIACLALAFYCYGDHWPLLLGALAARGLLISFLDNVYHYETPVSDVFFAKNLRLPEPLASLFLHFNLHGIHHINPAISWIDLSRAFDAQAGKYHGNYFATALRQLRGPIALQDLPQGAPVLRVRPYI